ncbi:AAA family ATPase [Mucilaginibacter boryungensis]|uniref:AAA family ATPase n=1 Tax=Mucilaginibacter boryungensis TaxID=768480 RepID=A0ABR9XEH6_9SPHI|nr:AAA family ATPase [Mucilaginibacter boryungensis]MBE9665389.1 AAA family ATPase [Mucilaginibacter boryungensis]
MKISIDNFKSIKELPPFQIKPLTILSGVNSSGKSSFIQLLLLLKQTIDLDSGKHQLFLSGDLYFVKKFSDIVTGKNLNNKLKISLEFDKEEILSYDSEFRTRIFDRLPSFSLQVDVKFDYIDEAIRITDFDITYKLPEGEKREQYVKFKSNYGANNTFSIAANNAIFGSDLWEGTPEIFDIAYSSIFPSSYETRSISNTPNVKTGEPDIVESLKIRHFPRIEGEKDLVSNFFNTMSYIGPIRELPRDEYAVSSIKNYVGKAGENTAQILENFATDPITYLKPSFADDGIIYTSKNEPLIDAVKYWMCDIFKIGKNIYAKKESEFYTIILQNDAGIETTIKHVGFGISQLLPIIVEGLLMQKDGTLILEQPEIHLHPKIQSLLFDFLYSLVLDGKRVIIETHSDHFITRMRRRIAENSTNELQDNINLTFMESENGEVMFGTIDLDDFGTLDYFPEDFVEQANLEMKAIVRAQMKKRTVKK